MPTFGRGLLIVCVLAVAAFAAVAQAGGLGANPANHPKLIDKPIDDFSYDRARRCRPGARPGAEALARWIERNTRGELWGIYRCEKSGTHSASVHAEGRAIDYRLDAGVPKERRAAMRLIRLLLEEDRNGNEVALARRMGVQA